MSQRRQSYVATEAVNVLFEGSKSLWKLRMNLDVLIVEHVKQNCLEVISYNADSGMEGQRIYLSAVLVNSKLDQNELKEKVNEKKEAIIRQRKPVNNQELTKEITVGMLSQYLLSRLNITTEENGSFKVALVPNLGDNVVDEATQRLDIMIDKPVALVGLQVAFQKKQTAKDFNTALGQLQVESAALKTATRLAELATSSVDGFKLMLAEKMKLENEMKKLYSPARLRWIKAINRVLIQLYCEKVRARLEAKEQAARLLSKLSPVAVAAVNDVSGVAEEDKQTPGGRRRPKILRRSIDNSLLAQSSSSTRVGGDKLPTLGGHNPHLESVSAHVSSNSHLPVLGSEKVRGREGSQKTILRRSMGQEHFPQFAAISEKAAPLLSNQQQEGVSAKHPPSLIKSYNAMAHQKLVQQPSFHGEVSSKSNRIRA